MATISNVKACVFDAYGTLFDIHAPTDSIASELGDKAKPLSEMWRGKQLQYTWLRSLMGKYAPFWQITGEALDYALAAHDIDDDDIRSRLMDLYMKLAAYPDAVSTLEKLKEAGYATGVLSNGSPDMLGAAVEASGLEPLLDHVLSVQDVGIFKPAPQVYQMAVDTFGVTRDEICFVSANSWDGWAAADYGFQVAHLNRFGQPKENLPGEPKVFLKSLSELPPELGH